LLAQIRVDATIERRQVRVVQTIRFQGPGTIPHPLRLRGPSVVAGLKAEPALRQSTTGEWLGDENAGLKDGVLRIEFAIPIPKSNADDHGPWTVPIPLFWPADVGRTETTMRLWNAAPGIQIDEVHSPGWRDLPSEPAADRPAIPAASLASSGSEIPLSLQLRAATSDRGTHAWVSRGFIRVRRHESGLTEYEARFLIHRWFADGLEVLVPASADGEPPELLIDGVPADVGAAPDPNDSSHMLMYVPLPGWRQQPVEIELRYQMAARSGSDLLSPPQLRDVAFDGPIRWHVRVPNGMLPLLSANGVEQHWSWRAGLLMPTASSAETLEEWFRLGTDSDHSGTGAANEVVFHQTSPMPVSVDAVSRPLLLVLFSGASFALGLGLVRLRSAIAGPVVAVLGGLIAAAAIRFPQPVAQAAAAAEPGLAAIVVVLGTQALVRWYRRRRVTHLAGFTRIRVEPPAGPSMESVPGSVRKPMIGSTGSNGVHSSPQPPIPTGSAADH
jgi:hypothetical protein